MRNGTLTTTCLLLALAAGLAGCNGAGTSGPTAPSTQLNHQRAAPGPSAPPPGSSYGARYTLVGVTLAGLVTAATPTGQAPVADATIYCDACGAEGHTWLRTDANGYYSFSGDLPSGGGIWLADGPLALWVFKAGYQDPPGMLPPAGYSSEPGWRLVPITGDTRFDIELVRE